MSATTLQSVDDREVVKCDHCDLVQFRTNKSACRRCHKSLVAELPKPEPSVVPKIITPPIFRSIGLVAGLPELSPLCG